MHNINDSREVFLDYGFSPLRQNVFSDMVADFSTRFEKRLTTLHLKTSWRNALSRVVHVIQDMNNINGKLFELAFINMYIICLY